MFYYIIIHLIEHFWWQLKREGGDSMLWLVGEWVFTLIATLCWASCDPVPGPQGPVSI